MKKDYISPCCYTKHLLPTTHLMTLSDRGCGAAVQSDGGTDSEGYSENCFAKENSGIWEQEW